MERAEYLGFKDVSEYLLALLAFDKRVNLETIPSSSGRGMHLVLPHRWGADPIRDVELKRMQLLLAHNQQRAAETLCEHIKSGSTSDAASERSLTVAREVLRATKEHIGNLEQDLQCLEGEMLQEGADREMMSREMHAIEGSGPPPFAEPHIATSQDPATPIGDLGKAKKKLSPGSKQA